MKWWVEKWGGGLPNRWNMNTSRSIIRIPPSARNARREAAAKARSTCFFFAWVILTYEIRPWDGEVFGFRQKRVRTRERNERSFSRQRTNNPKIVLTNLCSIQYLCFKLHQCLLNKLFPNSFPTWCERTNSDKLQRSTLPVPRSSGATAGARVR